MVTVGKYDGKHPCLTAATTANKVSVILVKLILFQAFPKGFTQHRQFMKLALVQLCLDLSQIYKFGLDNIASG